MINRKFSLFLVSIVFLTFFAVTKVVKAGSPISGSCGAMMSLRQLNEVYWHLLSLYPGFNGETESTNVDAMVLIDFDNKKIYINLTNGTLTKNAFPQGTTATYTSRTLRSIDFSITSGPLPQTYLLVDSSNSIPDLVILPVNSGNTFLIQAQNNKASGVCQKI